jgi:hypothetical protein
MEQLRDELYSTLIQGADKMRPYFLNKWAEHNNPCLAMYISERVDGKSESDAIRTALVMYFSCEFEEVSLKPCMN